MKSYTWKRCMEIFMSFSAHTIVTFFSPNSKFLWNFQWKLIVRKRSERWNSKAHILEYIFYFVGQIGDVHLLNNCKCLWKFEQLNRINLFVWQMFGKILAWKLYLFGMRGGVKKYFWESSRIVRENSSKYQEKHIFRISLKFKSLQVKLNQKWANKSFKQTKSTKKLWYGWLSIAFQK